MSDWRRYRRQEVLHAWAVRGGKRTDVDGSVYHVSYLGRTCFDYPNSILMHATVQGFTIALFKTRDIARQAMKDGPKKVHPGAMHGKDWVCWPNARVERVKITVEPV